MRFKHKIILVFFLILAGNNIKAQPCPDTSFTFATQLDIDIFQSLYPMCSVIPDSVNVTIMGDSITSLGPLAQIVVYMGRLEIRDCPMLTNLNGLHNITTIGNDSTDGLILRNLIIDSIKFLSQLSFVTGEFTIKNCNSLVTLRGLNLLYKVDGPITITDNAVLKNVNGLDSLNYIGEMLEISENPQLNTLTGLTNVDTLLGGPNGGIIIRDNDVLTNLLGFFHDSTVIMGDLEIMSNTDLNMCAVPSICNYLANPPWGAIISISGNTTGCNSQAQVIADCAFVTVEDIEYDEYKAIVTPNPVTDHYQIIAEYVWYTAEVYDAAGRNVQTIQAGNGPLFEFNHKPGIYFFKIFGDAGIVETVQVVK